MKHYEIKAHYMKRKQVYENALNDGVSKKYAITYSNIWYNITYMKNRYPKNIEEKVMQYAQF